MSRPAHRIVGTPRRRVDARAKVTGQTRFADDLFFPRMLHGRLLRSPHPHARIVSIDTARAEMAPGVHLVLTGRSFPITYGVLPVSHDEHALCPDLVRFVGDPVAAVIATDEASAERAVELIDVEYQLLRTFASPEDSLAHPEPRIHDVRRRGQHPQDCRAPVRRRRRGDRDGRSRVRRCVLLRGEHAFAARAARVRGAARSGWQARALQQHADAPLRAPRARQDAADVRGAHPRDCHAERRRIRRQERSVQSRDRRRQSGAAARSPGQVLSEPRRGVLLPSRPPSGADALPHGRDERRPHHRRGPADAARRRDRTDRTASPARSIPARCRRSPIRFRSTAFVDAASSRTSRRVVRNEVMARRRAGSDRKCSSTRSPSGSV